MKLCVTCLLSSAAVLAFLACSEAPNEANPTLTPGGSAGMGPAAGAGMAGGGGASPGGGGMDAAGMPPAAGAPMAGAGGANGGAGGTDDGDGGGGGVPAEPCPGVDGHPGPCSDYPPHTGFSIALAEEFDAAIDFATDPIWAWSDGALDEGQVRYDAAAITFADGNMTIEVSENEIAGTFSHAEEKEVATKPLRSGEFRTKYNNYRYGRYEVRMKAPTIGGDIANNGNYIATLFIFRTPKFESWNEIDIEVTGGAADELTTNLVHGTNRPTWMADFASPASTTLPFDSREDFHTYAFEWTSDAIVWYVDDAEVRRVDSTNPLGIPSLSAKIMMSMWIFAGGPDSFGGDPATNVYPFSVTYDYVRFYKWDSETTYPIADVNMLPAIDVDGSKNNPNDGVPDIAPVCGPGACEGADSP